jgi:hypothetical protein
MPGVTTTFVYGRCALGGTSRLPVFFPRYDDLRSEMRGTASGPLRSRPSKRLLPEAPQPGKSSYLVGGLGVLCTEAVGSVNGHK